MLYLFAKDITVVLSICAGLLLLSCQQSLSYILLTIKLSFLTAPLKLAFMRELNLFPARRDVSCLS